MCFCGVRVEVHGTDDKAAITIETRDGNNPKGLLSQGPATPVVKKLENIYAAPSFPGPRI